MKKKLKKYGSSLAVVITVEQRDYLGLDPDSEVEIQYMEDEYGQRYVAIYSAEDWEKRKKMIEERKN